MDHVAKIPASTEAMATPGESYVYRLVHCASLQGFLISNVRSAGPRSLK